MLMATSSSEIMKGKIYFWLQTIIQIFRSLSAKQLNLSKISSKVHSIISCAFSSWIRNKTNFQEQLINSVLADHRPEMIEPGKAGHLSLSAFLPSAVTLQLLPVDLLSLQQEICCLLGHLTALLYYLWPKYDYFLTANIEHFDLVNL